jgi:hypothetical protein
VAKLSRSPSLGPASLHRLPFVCLPRIAKELDRLGRQLDALLGDVHRVRDLADLLVVLVGCLDRGLGKLLLLLGRVLQALLEVGRVRLELDEDVRGFFEKVTEAH